MSDVVVACNCCMLECFSKKPSWCRNEQVCQGGQTVCSALSGPTDWILRFIKKTYLLTIWVDSEWRGLIGESS